MKSLLLGTVLLVASVVSIPAKANFYSGNEMLRFCNEAEQEGYIYSKGMCLGYVSGLHDAFEAAMYGLKQCHYKLPTNVTLGQIVAVARKYMNEHPERLHEAADILIWDALVKAFPCK